MIGKVGVFLEKANDHLISHCRCERTWIGAPAQMHCPWCGCGWMFICPECSRAFTFAKAASCDLTWEELAHRDLDRRPTRPTEDDIEQWIGFMSLLTNGVELGREYVYFDGFLIPVDAGPIEFEGIYAHHELSEPPQIAVAEGRESLDQVLANADYWRQRRVEWEQ